MDKVAVTIFLLGLAFCLVQGALKSEDRSLNGDNPYGLERWVLRAQQNAANAPNNQWKRGCRKSCGSLMSPGVSNFNKRYWYRRQDETDHCFPSSNSDHFVCCVGITTAENSHNSDDPAVATYNPLHGPITRNSYDPNNLSWCTCSRSICEDQLGGRVEWEGC